MSKKNDKLAEEPWDTDAELKARGWKQDKIHNLMWRKGDLRAYYEGPDGSPYIAQLAFLKVAWSDMWNEKTGMEIHVSRQHDTALLDEAIETITTWMSKHRKRNGKG